MKVECVHLFFQSIYVGNQLFFSVPVADIAVKGKALPRRVSLDRQLITRGNVREIHNGKLLRSEDNYSVCYLQRVGEEIGYY